MSGTWTQLRRHSLVGDSPAAVKAGPVALALLLGLFLLYGAGFAQPHILHNAAHDSRHSFAFPCH